VADSDRTNSTPHDDAAEIRRLLAIKIIDGLKEDKPKASFIAAAIKFLSEAGPAKAPTAPLHSMHGTDNLPFPARDALGAPHDGGSGRAGKLAEALKLPFQADGSPNPAYGPAKTS
jgi:hypothetical protein